jgi:hypothetical protein
VRGGETGRLLPEHEAIPPLHCPPRGKQDDVDVAGLVLLPSSR